MRIKFLKPNNPLLRKIAEEIPQDQISSTEIKSIIETMFKIAHWEQKGGRKPIMVGLAAPQIGISKRIILVDIKADGKGSVGNPRIYINPEIIWFSRGEQEWYEGCYSAGLPATPRKLGLRGGRANICGIVSRPVSIKVRAFSFPPRDWKAKVVEERYSGYVARIFQHEIDHLNGKIFIDHISNPDHLHLVKKEEFPLYRDQEAWRTWPKKYQL